MKTAWRYLDLMKKCLSFSLWKEPLIPYSYLKQHNMLGVASLRIEANQYDQVDELGSELNKVGLELAVRFEPDEALKKV